MTSKVMKTEKQLTNPVAHTERIITETEARELERELRHLLRRFEAAEVEDRAIAICSEQRQIWELQEVDELRY